MAFPQQIIPATPLAGGLSLGVGDIVGPASYATGGVFYSATVLNLNTVKYVVGMPLSVDGGFFIRVLSIAGQGASRFKVKWYTDSTGAEIGNGLGTVSGKIVRAMALGV